MWLSSYSSRTVASTLMHRASWLPTIRQWLIEWLIEIWRKKLFNFYGKSYNRVSQLHDGVFTQWTSDNVILRMGKFMTNIRSARCVHGCVYTRCKPNKDLDCGPFARTNRVTTWASKSGKQCHENRNRCKFCSRVSELRFSFIFVNFSELPYSQYSSSSFSAFVVRLLHAEHRCIPRVTYYKKNHASVRELKAKLKRSVSRSFLKHQCQVLCFILYIRDSVLLLPQTCDISRQIYSLDHAWPTSDDRRWCCILTFSCSVL